MKVKPMLWDRDNLLDWRGDEGTFECIGKYIIEYGGQFICIAFICIIFSPFLIPYLIGVGILKLLKYIDNTGQKR